MHAETTSGLAGRPDMRGRWLRRLAAGAALACAFSVLAAPPGSTAVEARYQQERAACERPGAGQDRAACIREAAAARDQALRGGLDNPSADFRANSLERCKMLQGADRRDCVSRMTGGGSVSGSVEGGGMLREFVTRDVGEAPQR